MITMLVQLIRHVLTKDDNSTFDEIKVGGFIVLLAASLALAMSCSLCLWLVLWKGQQFDANSFLSGVSSFLLGSAAVLGGMGGGTMLRDRIGRTNDASPRT